MTGRAQVAVVFADLEALRSKFLGQHDGRRVARAERLLIFRLAVLTYQAAGSHREQAEGKVSEALRVLERWREKEAEWFAVAHGLANALAVELDKEPPCHPSETYGALLREGAELPDRRRDVRHLRSRPGDRPGAGLRRRRLERRRAVRLMRSLSGVGIRTSTG